MGCRLVQAATLAAFIHIVFTSEVIAQDPTDLDKEDVPGRMLTHNYISPFGVQKYKIIRNTSSKEQKKQFLIFLE